MKPPKRFGVSLHVFTVQDAVRALEDNEEKNLRVHIEKGMGLTEVSAIAKALESNTSVKIL